MHAPTCELRGSHGLLVRVHTDQLDYISCVSQVWEGWFKLQCVQPIAINASLNEDTLWLTDDRSCIMELDYLLI